ncbi:wax ester synthase-like acyl-CoA acyltransferase domain-containing protein [Hyaloraphidium curvatum]|nr:wax ester synthase-like acyl-CoA acyltransferase domain-containing protein [Hyaloraphidium curvatum]
MTWSAFFADVAEWLPYGLPPKRDYLTGNDAAFLVAEIPNAMSTCAGTYILQNRITPDEGLRLADDFARFTGDRYLKRLVRNVWLLGRPYWADDESFDASNHFSSRSFPAGTTEPEIQRAVADFVASPYDWNRPLWSWMLIDWNGTSVLAMRFHHAITDGQGSTKAGLKWTASYDQALGRAVPGKRASEVSRMQFKAGKGVAARRRSSFVETAKTFFDRLVDAAKQALVLLWSILLYLQNMYFLLVATPASRRSPWSSKPKAQREGLPRKQLAWSEPVSLRALRAAKETVGCTVNDVMVGLLVGAVQRALAEKGQLKDGYLVFGVPTSYRSELDFSISNRSSGYMLGVPSDIPSPTARALEVSRRMDRLKKSIEPRMTYESQKGMAFPWLVSKRLALMGMGKIHGGISNVPGPTGKMRFGPAVVERMFPLGPPPGPQGMNMTILSYGDDVALTLYMDEDPSIAGSTTEWFAPGDARRVCELFAEEFRALQAECAAAEEGKLRAAAGRLGRERAMRVLQEEDGKAR